MAQALCTSALEASYVNRLNVCSTGAWRSRALWALSIVGRWDGGARLSLSACGRHTRRNCYAHSYCIPRCSIHSSGATALTMWLGCLCFPPCIYILPCAVAALLLPACGWLFLRAVPSGLLPGWHRLPYPSVCSALVYACRATRLLTRLGLRIPPCLLYIAGAALPMYSILAYTAQRPSICLFICLYYYLSTHIFTILQPIQLHISYFRPTSTAITESVLGCLFSVLG